MTTMNLTMTQEESRLFNLAKTIIFNKRTEECVISALLSDLSYTKDGHLTEKPIFILVVNDIHQGMEIAETIKSSTNGRFSAYPVLHEHFDANINKGISVV